MKALFLFLLIFPFSGFAQNVIPVDGSPCDMHGRASAESNTYDLNALKNRYTIPQKNDFDRTITFQRLLQSADPDAFSTSKAVRLSGYVLNVKLGGVESCNCRSKNPAFRDTHIELTPDETHTAPRYRLIAEVTPRLRRLLAKRGVDWSTEGLRKSLKGHTVMVTGWLLYDTEHESGAAANDPADALGAKNWRGTCWEVHPVTAIDFLDAVTDHDETPNKREIAPDAQPDGTTSEGTPKFTYMLLGLIMLILVLLVFLYVRSRR